jgi:phosphoglycolate phosphatase
MPKYKHVIWDWNGTLLDDAKLCCKIIGDLAVRNGLPAVTFEQYLNVFTFPVREYYGALGFPTDNGEFERLGKIFIEEYERKKFEAKLHEGARETIENLREKGIGQSVLSAYSIDKLNEILRYFGLADFFDEIAGLDNIYAEGKILIGKKLIEKLGLRNKEAVLVGDTLHDAEVAESIGADVVLISHGHQHEARLKKSGYPVVASFDELKEIILQ